jgi:acyl-coenzyme A thioesterase PaaI-like protein
VPRVTTARHDRGNRPQEPDPAPPRAAHEAAAGSGATDSGAAGAAPFRWATSLGLEWSVEAPGLVATFRPGVEHRGRPGYLHGGLAATCLDETMASLGYAIDGLHTQTATLNLRYRKPVALDGSPLRIEAWRTHPEPRRTQKVYGRILLASGVVAVEATGLFVRLDLVTRGST